MIRLLLDEFYGALNRVVESGDRRAKEHQEEISVVSGVLIYPYVRKMMSSLMAYAPGFIIHPYRIVNEFFGEGITVTGLLTGQDIIKQLKGKPLGQRLLIPHNVLRTGENYLLDDVTVPQMEEALGVKIDMIPDGGDAMMDLYFGTGNIEENGAAV